MLFESDIEDYQPLKERASAQISWAVGRLNYVNNTNGIRQAAVFADHFRERWAGGLAASTDYMTPVSSPEPSSYIFEVEPSDDDANATPT